jgi:hypothetical protein
MKQISKYTMFCEGYLAMLELEEMNESHESSGEIYEWEFFLQTLLLLRSVKIKNKY